MHNVLPRVLSTKLITQQTFLAISYIVSGVTAITFKVCYGNQKNWDYQKRMVKTTEQNTHNKVEIVNLLNTTRYWKMIET